MKIAVMTTLLVITILAVLAENPGGERRKPSYNVHKWCRSNVQNRRPMLMNWGPYKKEVIRYCMDIVYNYIIRTGAETGCKRLRDMIKSMYLYSSYYGYPGTVRLVYSVLCTASMTATLPTTPTTPITPIISAGKSQAQECGRSDSLKAHLLQMSNISQEHTNGQRVYQKRIIGGIEVNDCSMVPWQVRLQIGSNLCGGSIISDRHILTACHCVEKARSLKDVKVILAEANLHEDHSHKLVVFIRNMSLHHDFNPSSFVSDIAVVTLKDPIVFNNPCLEIICRNPNFDFVGKSCFVSGWGREDVRGSVSSTLKVVRLQISHGKKCNSEFGVEDPDYVYDKEQMICAGHAAGGKDSCQGDSGGPLVCLDTDTDRFVQVGVVSHGKGCGEAGFPGIYTRVANFNDWINKVMAENSY